MSSLRQKIRSYVEANVLGKERALDTFVDNPLATYSSFVDLGVANWWISKDFGGRGVSLEDSVDLVDELSYGDAGLAFAYLISIVPSTMIELYGTPAQKATYLRRMAEDGCFAATIASERAAGSELLKTQTTAVRAGDSYRITGQKLFSTNAGFADHVALFVRTPNEDPDFKCLVIRRTTPGLRIVKRWYTLGLRSAATYEVALEDCLVPADAALAPNGLRLLEAAMNPSRTLIACCAVGIARRLRDLCLDYAKHKRFRDDHLNSSPVFAAKLGQMEMQIEAMRSVCKSAAREYDELRRSDEAGDRLLGAGMLKSVAVAKLFCGQVGWQIASMASEMFGGLGYTEDSLVGKLLRDMRHVSIIEGGEDVMRELLYFRHVLPKHAG
ncbi:MAG TPA: acyl-CoA dehydrogenase family protein [Kofleriaceae bacterium]|jgi:alkylation response protein AidB-like acyl-CoA dehydrogenase|nr:acyl-CoA dehydrogenase family protein [Kofleriaceae bacterium]